MSDRNAGGPPPGSGGNQPDWYNWAGDGRQNPNQRPGGQGGQGGGNPQDFYQWSGPGQGQGQRRQGNPGDYYQYSGTDGGQQPNRFYEDAYNQQRPGDRNFQIVPAGISESGRPIFIVNCRNAYFNMPDNDYRNGGPDFRGCDPNYMRYRQQMENTPVYTGQQSYANRPDATQWNPDQQRYLEYQRQQWQAYQQAQMYANAQRAAYSPQQNYPVYRPGNNPTGYDQGYQQPTYTYDQSTSAAGPGTLIYSDTRMRQGNYPGSNQPWNQPGYPGTPPFVPDGGYQQGPTSNQGVNDFLSIFKTVAPAVVATMPYWHGGHDRGNYPTGNYPNQYAWNQPNYNYGGGYRQGNYPTGYYGGNNGYYGNNGGIQIRARIPF